MSKIWSCKIGEVDDSLVPPGGDSPLRQAVREAWETAGREWADR